MKEGCFLDLDTREYLIERVSFESKSEIGKEVSCVDSQESRIPGKERARAKSPGVCLITSRRAVCLC